ncbi:MAG: hypothetical protein CMI53_03905 [Parcubacteria group bacterium]|jgi:bifunctional UDP-N-acetylglucosamine pyrophosphorylase/glucosamine-1-phosphate N-acetyltransferase|nr:hypothetical protein [Parcubacteria group bacterium]
MKENKIQILVLAAGVGKRMGNKELPKVLIPFKGKHLVQHLLDAIKESGVCEKSALVVGKMADLVKKALGPDYIYILQPEQLGTGHAVMTSRKELEGIAQHIMVWYGDAPLVTSITIKKIANTHLAEKSVITMATTKVSDFKDWRQAFNNFGRIVKDDQGKINKIVEFRDATAEQKEIKEINPGYYCFEADWLWQNLDKLKNDNDQGEYYLTDLVDMAFKQGKKITTVDIEPKEALGINTEEQLKSIEKLA